MFIIKVDNSNEYQQYVFFHIKDQKKKSLNTPMLPPRSKEFLLNSAKHESFSVNKYENMKMPAIVGIFIFISIQSFMLSCI